MTLCDFFRDTNIHLSARRGSSHYAKLSFGYFTPAISAVVLISYRLLRVVQSVVLTQPGSPIIRTISFNYRVCSSWMAAAMGIRLRYLQPPPEHEKVPWMTRRLHGHQARILALICVYIHLNYRISFRGHLWLVVLVEHVSTNSDLA